MKRNSKPWYASRVVWANVLTISLGVIFLFQTSPLFEQQAQWLLLLNGIVNILLRFVTSQSLDGGPK